MRLKAQLGWRGESPLQVERKPVTDCNCVVVRRGGQQQEVNDQSVRSLPVREETELDSAGERWRACSAVAKPRVPVGKQTRFDLPMGYVPWQGGASAGGWRQNGRKAECVNQGDLPVEEPNGWSPGRHPSTTATERAGVRAPIVATKGRNGPGAKGAQEGG